MQLYAVHMRNTSGSTWATFVKDGRDRAGLSQKALADVLGIERTTVWRWENAGVRPDSPEMVAATADAIHQDRNAAMHAAGLAIPDFAAPEADPRLQGLDASDPIVRRIMGFEIDEEMRAFMLDRHRRNLERDRQRYLEDLDRDLEQFQRRTGAA